MRINFLSTARKIFILILIPVSFSLLAQQDNDRCDTATLLDIGLSADICIPIKGDTRNTEDATLLEDSPEVCSGSWYEDDVWYSIVTNDTVPYLGVTVEVRLDTTVGTELTELGMAIYADCGSGSKPLDCFTQEQGRKTIEFPSQCLAPNSNYYIRIWSSPEARLNEGTFSICAYESPRDSAELNNPIPRIIYQETFDEGFGDWESVSLSQTNDGIYDPVVLVDDHWMWAENTCLPSISGLDHCIFQPSNCKSDGGAIGVPAKFYQYGRETPIPGIDIVGPFPTINTYIVSPSIDLSNADCVRLTWLESGKFLNGGELSSLGPYVQYSIDNGETWNNPSFIIGSADVAVNFGAAYSTDVPFNAVERSIPLIGAEGNSEVKIRFGFEGDFYYWIVDNIKIVEASTKDIFAQNNFFATPTINPMSIHMVDSYDFLIDIANLACEDLNNVNANLAISNSVGEQVHNIDLAYGTIQRDTIAARQPFLQPFTPPALVEEYTCTYTVSADGDNTPDNNKVTFQASVVDEMVFRKESGIPNAALSPNQNLDVFWTKNEAFTWEVGNIFFAPNATAISGEPLQFKEISFQLDNPSVLTGDILRVWLYEIRDNNFDYLISKDDESELTKIGTNAYFITGLEEGMITVEIFSCSEDPMLMKPNTHYMATIETITQEIRNEAMAIAANDSYDYSAALLNTRQTANGDLTKVRYAHAFAISKENIFRIGPGNPDSLMTGNFPENITPIIRLGYEIAPTISTVEINHAIEVAISPIPTDSDLVVSINIKEATDMEISIIDLSGNVVSKKIRKGVTKLREEFDVNSLANGVYLIHISSKDGIQTEKFVVSK